MQARARMEMTEAPDHDTVWVVKSDENGFQVYNPAEPDRVFHVSGNRMEPRCTCPEFQWKTGDDPESGCIHIAAVMDYLGEGEPQRQRPNRGPIPTTSTGNGPQPVPASGGNGNGAEIGSSATMLTLKRSVSPNGKIDSLSVEITLPIGGLVSHEVRDCARRSLACQEDIVAAFLAEIPALVNGNGHAGSPGVRDGAVPATLRDVGSMQTRWGWRYFINVEANGNLYKLFGNRKQLGDHLASVGQAHLGEQLSKGTVLDVPCKALLEDSEDGRYTNVVQLYPSSQRQTRGR